MKNEQKRNPADIFFPLNNDDIVLYHYTSLESLKSIVENNTLRFSDYRFVNDINEFSFCIENLDSVLEEFNVEDVAPIKQVLNDLQNGRDLNFKIAGVNENNQLYGYEQLDTDASFYIFSMTENDDSLNMWKMYSENGVRIKLNTKILHLFLRELQRKYLPLGIINIGNDRVNYDCNLEYEREIVSALIETNTNKVSPTLYDILFRLCILRKDVCFSYEKEYRIGFKFFDKLLIGNDTVRKVFITRNNTLIPQLEFSNVPIPDLIEDILISPYNKSDRSVLGLKTFLKKYLDKDIDVRPSQIKIR